MSRWSRRVFLRASFLLGGGLVACHPNPTKPREHAFEFGPDGLDASSRPEVMWDGVPEQRGEPELFSEPMRDADGPEREYPEPIPEASHCPNPFAGGRMLGVVAFTQEGGRPLDSLDGNGWDGRLYSDLSKLTPASLIVSNERFFVRTRYPDQIDPSKAWEINIHGHVEAPVLLSMDDLKEMIKPMGTVLLECSGNGKAGHFGLLSAANWDGIPIEQVLAKAKPTAKATRILISGFDQHSTPSTHSTPGCSWVFTLAELKYYGAFLATHMNGVPLPKDHGFPIRLIVPRWYGCTHVKWLNEIQFVDDSEPATSQMKEFASRTHQTGTHALAREYRAANIQQSAMPIRIEQWEVEGAILYRVIGVMWGGEKPTTDLAIQFESGGQYEHVSVCPIPTTNNTWSLWEHAWRPAKTGAYAIRLKVNDPTIPTIRLDQGFYLRQVQITKV